MKPHANHLELSKIISPKCAPKQKHFMSPANINKTAVLEVLTSSLSGRKWFGLKNSTCITFSAKNIMISEVFLKSTNFQL